MKNILIVEDTRWMREHLEQEFKRLGYQVATAGDGLEAKRLIEGRLLTGAKFHLVITDTQMPVMNGPDLISWIKEKTPDTPCVLMSAGREPDGHKANLFVQKGVGVIDVVSIAKRFLEEVNQDTIPTAPSFPHQG